MTRTMIQHNVYVLQKELNIDEPIVCGVVQGDISYAWVELWLEVLDDYEAAKKAEGLMIPNFNMGREVLNLKLKNSKPIKVEKKFKKRLKKVLETILTEEQITEIYKDFFDNVGYSLEYEGIEYEDRRYYPVSTSLVKYKK